MNHSSHNDLVQNKVNFYRGDGVGPKRCNKRDSGCVFTVSMEDEVKFANVFEALVQAL